MSKSNLLQWVKSSENQIWDLNSEVKYSWWEEGQNWEGRPVRLEPTRMGGVWRFGARVGSGVIAMDTLGRLCPLSSDWLGHGEASWFKGSQMCRLGGRKPLGSIREVWAIHFVFTCISAVFYLALQTLITLGETEAACYTSKGFKNTSHAYSLRRSFSRTLNAFFFKR